MPEREVGVEDTNTIKKIWCLIIFLKKITRRTIFSFPAFFYAVFPLLHLCSRLRTFLFVFAKERSDCGNLPGGRSSTEYMLRAFSVGYFACAQYDVLFIPYRHFVPLPPKEEAKLHVILSMSSEQTCLQGFANEDIHKALAFLIKNAENGSFNARALSAE